jgi:hypothetical protein
VRGGSGPAAALTTGRRAVAVSQLALKARHRGSAAGSSTRPPGCSERQVEKLTSSANTGCRRAPRSGPRNASPLACCHQEPVSSSRMMKFWLLMPLR